MVAGCMKNGRRGLVKVGVLNVDVCHQAHIRAELQSETSTTYCEVCSPRWYSFLDLRSLRSGDDIGRKI